MFHQSDHSRLQELFLQLGQGDHTAFTELFHHYNQRLYPFLLKKVKSEAIAEELVQEIFLKVWTNREKIGPLENPEGYIYRMAANAALNLFRKLALERNILQLQKKEEDQQDLGAEMQLREVEALVEQAIDQLPAQRKIIYSLRENGMSYQEIGTELGLSINTVKNQLVDASKSIRSYLIQHGISPIVFLYFCLLIKKSMAG